MLGRCGKKKLCACVEKKKVKTAFVVVVGMEEVCLKWMKKNEINACDEKEG